MILRVIGIRYAFDQACAAGAYHKDRVNTVSRLILTNKTNRAAAPLMAEAMNYVIRGRFPSLARVDAIAAVPMSPAKYATKGFNHALEIANALGRELSLPVVPDVLVKVRDSDKPQHKSNLRERFENVNGCYAAGQVPRGIESVLLVDDTYITGSDVHYCAEALKTVGVKRVFVVCAARGVMLTPGQHSYLDGYFDA